MESAADDLIEALRAPDAIADSDLVGWADRLAEDVSRQLYAIRQDLAAIDPEQPRSIRAREDLLGLIRRISVINESLRVGPAGATSMDRIEAASAAASGHQSDAQALAAQSRVLGVRNAKLRRSRAGSPERETSLTTTARAKRLAQSVHQDQEDRYGRPRFEHVQRVASSVPSTARAVALVHDVAERSEKNPGDVARLVGLDDDEHGALELLTKRVGESLLDHTRRVLDSPYGASRELALTVKRADVEDHARRTPTPSRVYGQARRLLTTAQATSAAAGEPERP